MPANRSALAPKKESDEANDWREGREGSDGIRDDQSSQDDRFGEFLRKREMTCSAKNNVHLVMQKL